MKFTELKTNVELSNYLNIRLQDLYYSIYGKTKPPQYIDFEINKKNGESRLISAPNDYLKKIQTKIMNELSVIYNPPLSVHGFVYGRSIVSNAKLHEKKRFVFNFDLSNFFPTITAKRIFGLLWKSNNLNFSKEVAYSITNLCCNNGSLPQGSPASPILSNMICKRMDREFLELAKEYKCYYTRYADDITISIAAGEMPPEICSFDDSGNPIPGGRAYNIIVNNGFLVNTKKTRLQSNKRRQVVTGIKVNSKINLDRRYIRNIRAIIHSWDKDGYDNARQRYCNTNNLDYCDLISILQGKINFVIQVKGYNNSVAKSLCRNFVKVYPEFKKRLDKLNRETKVKNFFISHASEDKDDFVRPLANELIKNGFTVWYDEYELSLGDSLREKIDEGLAYSEKGLIILSESFFKKDWPSVELDALFERNLSEKKNVLFPVWYKISKAKISEYSPMMASKLSLQVQAQSISEIVVSIKDAYYRNV